jgi:hypothetical protein
MGGGPLTRAGIVIPASGSVSSLTAARHRHPYHDMRSRLSTAGRTTDVQRPEIRSARPSSRFPSATQS